MDMNEMMNQLASNPQMMAQLVQTMQQNGMIPPNMGQPRMPMNWNMPTNPMAMMWGNNLATMMSNMNTQNNAQSAQNQGNQQPSSQTAQTENMVSSVRVVKSPNEIKADEILMNGNISLFLQDDLNVVYGKRWTNNGTIDNMRFIRETDDAQNESVSKKDASTENVNLDVDAILGKISEVIDGKLDQFVKDYSLEKRGATKSGNSKKGAEENGN